MYDGARFSEGKQLTTVDLFRRAHDEIGLQPSTVFWFGETDGPTDGERYSNGFFVAVFDTPPDITGTDVWDIPDAQIEQVVAEVNRALPECHVEAPVRVRLGGLKGYFTTFTLALDGQQYRGWWVMAVGDIHTYEIVAQTRTQDWDDLRPALAQVFWTFRPDAKADVSL